MTTIIYTAIFGRYDTLIEVPDELFEKSKLANVRWLCFTDDPGLNSDTWEIVVAKNPQINFMRASRRIKILAHQFLPDCDQSIWIDGNITCRIPVWEVFDDHRFELGVFIHPRRNCSYQEIIQCLQNRKLNKKSAANAKAFLEVHNITEGSGLLMGGCIFRRHTESIKHFNEAWWGFFLDCPHRDQLSLLVAIQWSNVEVLELPQDVFNRNFRIHPHRNAAETITPNASFLNDLLLKYDFGSYLEIGTASGSTFLNIDVPDRIGVDPSPRAVATHRMTSDDFFERNRRNFDLIFIDGLHERSQVVRDVDHSLQCLNEGGLIVIHDCLPREESQQLPDKPSRGFPWCGDVWKAIVDLRQRESIDVCVVNEGWGYGIVIPRENIAPLPWLVPSLHVTWDYYSVHKSWMLNVIAAEYVAEFLDGYPATAKVQHGSSH